MLFFSGSKMASNNQQHAILDLGIDDLQFTTNDYKTTTNQVETNILEA